MAAGAAAGSLLAVELGCDFLGGAAHIASGFIPTPESPLTPTSDFFMVRNFAEPQVPPTADWRLSLRGLVNRRVELRRQDLDAFPRVTREVTLECIGNGPGGGLISSAAFTGVRLRDVLAAADVDGHAHGLHVEGSDGYFSYLPLDAGRTDDALLVHTMNGEPLLPPHGAPVRALFPGKHGMLSVKWLRTLTLTREWGTYGALTSLTNVVEGVTPIRSRIDLPPEEKELILGEPAEVTGLALTAGQGVARVEVEVEGAWREAELTFNTLDDDRSPYLWSLWRLRYTPAAPGPQTLRVRAFDPQGNTQGEEPRFPYDSGVIDAVHVVVRG